MKRPYEKDKTGDLILNMIICVKELEYDKAQIITDELNARFTHMDRQYFESVRQMNIADQRDKEGKHV